MFSLVVLLVGISSWSVSGGPVLYGGPVPVHVPVGAVIPLPLLHTIRSQYHSQDELGQYSYGYSNEHSSKVETKDFNGLTSGGYSYIDANGLVQAVNYISDDENGFRVAASNLPVAPIPHPAIHIPLTHPAVPITAELPQLPEPVSDTPEVQKAKEEHAKAKAEAEKLANEASSEESTEEPAETTEKGSESSEESASSEENSSEEKSKPEASPAPAVPETASVQPELVLETSPAPWADVRFGQPIKDTQNSAQPEEYTQDGAQSGSIQHGAQSGSIQNGAQSGTVEGAPTIRSFAHNPFLRAIFQPSFGTYLPGGYVARNKRETPIQSQKSSWGTIVRG